MAIDVKYIGGSMDGRVRRTRSLCDIPRIHRGVWREFDKATNKPTGREKRENYRLDYERREYVLIGDAESAMRQAVDVPAMWFEMSEQEELERTVIDIVKRWAKAGVEDAHAQIAADNELRDAVTALLSFEAEQKK